jgi:hypothetical protein
MTITEAALHHMSCVDIAMMWLLGGCGVLIGCLGIILVMVAYKDLFMEDK